MADYRKEFPDFEPATHPAIPEGFEDVSWHNETCPHFHNKALRLSIFVDFAAPEAREFPESPRFSVATTDDVGYPLDDQTGNPATDDWAEILAYIAKKGPVHA